MVLSSYGRRHAGHSPFMFIRILLKQNWHICRAVSQLGGYRGTSHRCVPGIRKGMVGSSGRRDRTPRCKEDWCTGSVSGLEQHRYRLDSKSVVGRRVGGMTGASSYQQSSSSSMYVSWGAMAAGGYRCQGAKKGRATWSRGKRRGSEVVGRKRFEAGRERKWILKFAAEAAGKREVVY